VGRGGGGAQLYRQSRKTRPAGREWRRIVVSSGIDADDEIKTRIFGVEIIILNIKYYADVGLLCALFVGFGCDIYAL